MTQTRFGEQACQKVLARLDSYIDNELLTESSLELMEHFQRCTACTRESQERRNVRARLQTAVRGCTRSCSIASAITVANGFAFPS